METRLATIAFNGLTWFMDPNGMHTARGATPERLWRACGLLPTFLDAKDERAALQQFDAHYAFAGGFIPILGGAIVGNIWTFLEDEPLDPIASAWLREDHVHIYQSAFVAIVHPDGKYLMSKLD